MNFRRAELGNAKKNNKRKREKRMEEKSKKKYFSYQFYGLVRNANAIFIQTYENVLASYCKGIRLKGHLG